MSAFLRMGGYAAYVWPCIGLAVAVLAWNVVAARRMHAEARERALRRSAAGKGAP
jgi:heme exporter protein CcmD